VNRAPTGEKATRASKEKAEKGSKGQASVHEATQPGRVDSPTGQFPNGPPETASC
jgi:hypothetical protein